MSTFSKNSAAARGMALELLVEQLRRLGTERRSDHRRLAADSVLVFGCSVVLGRSVLWTGDLDVTEAEPNLVCLCDCLGEGLALHEPPALGQCPEAPLITISPVGRVRFDERVVRRGEDGRLVRVGVRPEPHPPNKLAAWVFRQHKVWVDTNGTEYEIESMPRDHARCVLRFCDRRAERIRETCFVDAYGEALELSRLLGPCPDARELPAEIVDAAWPTAAALQVGITLDGPDVEFDEDEEEDELENRGEDELESGRADSSSDDEPEGDTGKAR